MDNKCDLEFSNSGTATSCWLDSPYSEKCRDIQDLQYECYRQAVKEYIEAVFFRF